MNMPTETFVAFLAMTTFMSFVPGPSVLFVATQGAWRGRAAGLSAVAGVQLGVLTYFLLTAFGLTRIIAASGTAFMIVKWVGAAYLLWLGVTAIVGTLRRQAQPPPQLRPSAYGFRDGLVVALFDNGQSRPVYRIPLARFASPENLAVRDGNAYQMTNASGGMFL